MTQERIDGKTPNGGEYTITYYLDEDGNPIEKEKSFAVEIIEYDKDDNVLFRTYMVRDEK